MPKTKLINQDYMPRIKRREAKQETVKLMVVVAIAIVMLIANDIVTTSIW